MKFRKLLQVKSQVEIRTLYVEKSYIKFIVNLLLREFWNQ